jgi:hypothetical protein
MPTNNSRDESSRSSPPTGSTTRKRSADEDFKLWSRVLERRKRQCANLNVSVVREILQQQRSQQDGSSSVGETNSPGELAGLLKSCFEQASDERLPHTVRRTSLEKLQELCSKVEHAVQQQPQRPPPIEPPPNGHRFFNATSSNEVSSDHQGDQVPARRPSSLSSSPVDREINSTKKQSPSIHIQLPKPTTWEKSWGSTSMTPTNGNRPQQDSAPPSAPASIPPPGFDKSASSNKASNGRSSVTTPNTSTLLGMLHGTNQTLDFAASTSRRPAVTAATGSSSRWEPATSTISTLSSGRDPQNRSIAPPPSATNGVAAAAAPSYSRVSGTAQVARTAPVPGRKALSAMERGIFFAAAPTPVAATNIARFGAPPTPVPTTNIARPSTATNERRGSHTAAPAPISATNASTSSTATYERRGSNGNASSSASTGEALGQTAAHPPSATSPRALPIAPYYTGSDNTTADAGGLPRQSQTTLGPPSISSTRSEARFTADTANSQYSGSLEGRNASTVIFKKYSPSYDMNQAMNNRLQKWDPFWFTKRVVVSGMTSPIESVQPLQSSQPRLKTVTSIMFELSPDTIRALSPAGGNSNNHLAHGDFRLILRMLPVTWDLKKRADCHLWPKGTFLTIDKVPVQLMQRKQQSHAPTQWYGMCELLDVSSRAWSPSRIYSVELCSQDEEQFLFCLSICQYQSAVSIVDNLIKDNTPSLEQSIEKAIHRINQEMIVLDSDDENEQQDVGKFVFSLTCPISKRLMKIPVRGKDCKHWQVGYYTPPPQTLSQGTRVSRE